MTSPTFERVRLFTDVEVITLGKWLISAVELKEAKAAEILNAGLLVEHMIAEIPLDQNLADVSELGQLADNAKKVFGLIVCFGCNRAFASEQDQLKNCPNCKAELTKDRLASPPG